MRRLRPALGTFVEVGLVGCGVEAVEPAFERVFQVLAEAEARWSFQRAESLLSVINRSAGHLVTIDRLTHRLLRLALAIMRASGGRFDITVGAELVRLGALPWTGPNPSMGNGDANDVVLEPGRVRLMRPMCLTLDGIAKGFSVDLAVETLRAAGIHSGWVNAGGDLRAFGMAAVPVWRRLEDGRVEALGLLRDAAVATSGSRPALDADRPAVVIGQDRLPAAPGTWSVLARSAWRADALTKVAANTPPAARYAEVARLGGRLLEGAA